VGLFSFLFERRRKEPEVKRPRRVEVKRELATSFLETYPVYEPYVYVGIAQEPDGTKRYVVIEPTLEEAEVALLERIRELLKVYLEVDVRGFKDDKEAEEFLRREVAKVVRRLGLKVRRAAFDKIMYYLARDMIRYGPIDPLMKDPHIEDISCDGVNIPIYIWHREYESMPTNIMFHDQEELDRFVLRLSYLSGRHISSAQPIVDASLPDGSRVQLTYGTEVTKKGSTFTIRKFREDPFSIVDLIKFNTLNSEMAALLWFAIEHKASILLAGGTGSGKTTTINCLSLLIRPDAKIVTIEDTPEINLAHPNWIQAVSRPAISGVGEVSLYDLLKAALRQRPEYIIVGEVRGAEATTLFQAIATGHAGLSSIHADSVAAVLRRLTSDPINIPKSLVPSVNFIVLVGRISVGGRPARRVLSVTELVGLDPRTEEFVTNEVYRYDPPHDTFIYGGRSYIIERIASSKGMRLDRVRQDLQERKMVLDWMVAKNIRNYREVTKIVGLYYTDREALMSRIRIEQY
jgi:flagellar protein FlaI